MHARSLAAGTALLTPVVFVVPIGPAQAAVPDAPELVAPAAGHVFGTTDPQVFTVRTTDPDDNTSVASIEVTNVDTDRVFTFPTLPGESGEVVVAIAAPPLTPGRYRWRAQATDTTGGTGPWSETRAFEVGPNHPPNPPVLLSPADGAMLRRAGNEPFSISVL